MGRYRTSPVYDYFDTSSKVSAKCNKCSHVLTGVNVSNMEKHLQIHKDIWAAYLQKKKEIEDAKQETPKTPRKRPLDSKQPKFSFEPQAPNKLNPAV